MELTEKVLGRGSWGEVKVAKFRGLRVAAKFLHNMIISEYNQHLFSREMTIAAKIRHPNLLLFIGATRERERGSHPHRAYAYQPAQGAGKKEFYHECRLLPLPKMWPVPCAIYTSGSPPRSSIVTSAVPMCYSSPFLMAGGQRFLIMALLIS